MIIETQRLIIRELSIDDTDEYVTMASDGSLSDIFGDCSDCSDWMSQWINDSTILYMEDNPHNEYLAYTIEEKDSHKVIGSIGCSAYDDLKEVGITYFIGSDYRRKGYATEAAIAYVSYFLEQYPSIPRIIATVRTENMSSCKTVEKSGFVLEETKIYQDINDTEAHEYNFYAMYRK